MSTISRVIGGACFGVACIVAGAAGAQSDPWATRPLIGGTGTWKQNADAGVQSTMNNASAAAQKGATAASKVGTDGMRATSYGVAHPGEVAAKSAKASGQGYEEARAGFMDAAESPMRDLNLMQKQIPAVLLAAEAQPYSTAGLESCKLITDQVVALDLALGPDVDTPNIEKVRDSYARSATFVAEVTLSAVKDATTKFLPGRSTIRRISGANRYDRDVKNAILAGAVRRGFLKAFGMMHDCGWPASPISFQPVNAQPADSLGGVRTTQAQTIASGPMVVTVSTVSVDPAGADDAAVVATQRPRLGFAASPEQEHAGAWAIGRPRSAR